MLPGLLENLLESGNLFCSATAATKTTLGITQLWFSNFRGILAYSSWKAKQRDALVVGSFTPVSHFVYWFEQFANFGALPKRHPT